MTMQRYQGGAIQVGATQMSANDFIPPRIKIAQQMAQEVADKKAQPGDFYDTLRGISYGPKITFVPLMTFMQRVFITREGDRKDRADAKLEAAGLEPLPDGDGLMCRSIDMLHGQGSPGIACASCPLAEWEGRTGAPLCSETYNLAALTEQGDPVFFGFSKSSAKVGKNVFSQIRLTSQSRSIATRLWVAETRQEKNDKGIFFVPDVRQTTDPVPPELAKDVEYWNGQFTGVAFDVAEQEAAQEPDEPTSPRPF